MSRRPHKKPMISKVRRTSLLLTAAALKYGVPACYEIATKRLHTKDLRSHATEKCNSKGDTNMPQDQLTLPDEGKVIFQYPFELSREALGDVEEWLTLQVRKLRRHTKKIGEEDGSGI